MSFAVREGRARLRIAKCWLGEPGIGTPLEALHRSKYERS